jgi:hypothetical protein
MSSEQLAVIIAHVVALGKLPFRALCVQQAGRKGTIALPNFYIKSTLQVGKDTLFFFFLI